MKMMKKMEHELEPLSQDSHSRQGMIQEDKEQKYDEEEQHDMT